MSLKNDQLRRGFGETAIPQRHSLERILATVRHYAPEVDEEAVFTSLSIVEICTRTLDAASRHYDRYGLSQARFTILMFLFNYPDERWTPASLAGVIRVKRPTCTKLLKVLERDNWISYHPDDTDGRKRLVTLSEQGRSRFPEIMLDHFDRIGRAFSAFALRLMARKELESIAEAWESLTQFKGETR
jgi:DNA-binding MarR family transcriptional regulator